MVKEPLVVYLVRHAEKQEPPADTTDDPPLTTAGTARALLLAQMLADTGVGRVLSSDFTRTRDTAGPVAERLGLPVELYNARDMPAFAAELMATSGRVLVVGHSNTTPQLVELLGGTPGSPIAETEYDRLYLVTRSGGRVTTEQLRFGD